jgi:gamma-glutamyltranspeptidase/glutathione hydrolase
LKSVVVEIKNGFAAVLSDDGSIVKIKNENYVIGQVIEMKIKKIHFSKKWALGIASAAVLLLSTSIGAWAYTTSIDFHLNPQQALDAPRWQWIRERTVEVEHSFPHHIAQELSAMGHDIRYTVDSTGFGRGQIIWRNDEGVLAGGTEPRTDGTIAVW